MISYSVALISAHYPWSIGLHFDDVNTSELEKLLSNRHVKKHSTLPRTSDSYGICSHYLIMLVMLLSLETLIIVRKINWFKLIFNSFV